MSEMEPRTWIIWAFAALATQAGATPEEADALLFERTGGPMPTPQSPSEAIQQISDRLAVLRNRP